jgi:hypothetical protein
MHVSHMLYSFTFLLYSRKVLMYQSARPRFNPPLFAELWRNRGVNSVQAVLCCATPLLHLGNGKHDIISTLCSLSPSLSIFRLSLSLQIRTPAAENASRTEAETGKNPTPRPQPLSLLASQTTHKQTRHQNRGVSSGQLNSAQRSSLCRFGSPLFYS